MEKERRSEAGKRIDPATAEVWFTWGQVIDPYNEDPNLPDDCRCIGRIYWACAPESDTAVCFDDLPEATHEALWKRIERKDTPEEDRVVLVMKPGNAGGGKDPDFWRARDEEEDW